MRIDDVLRRIQGEFIEMPGLRLTPAQAQRLWGLERAVCDELPDRRRTDSNRAGDRCGLRSTNKRVNPPGPTG